MEEMYKLLDEVLDKYKVYVDNDYELGDLIGEFLNKIINKKQIT